MNCAHTAVMAACYGKHGLLPLPVHPAQELWSVRRRQVSWLAGQHLQPRLPKPMRGSVACSP
jgi:hypothetical protein